jgi:hypothetical protein
MNSVNIVSTPKPISLGISEREGGLFTVFTLFMGFSRRGAKPCQLHADKGNNSRSSAQTAREYARAIGTTIRRYRAVPGSAMGTSPPAPGKLGQFDRSRAKTRPVVHEQGTPEIGGPK